MPSPVWAVRQTQIEQGAGLEELKERLAPAHNETRADTGMEETDEQRFSASLRLLKELDPEETGGRIRSLLVLIENIRPVLEAPANGDYRDEVLQENRDRLKALVDQMKSLLVPWTTPGMSIFPEDEVRAFEKLIQTGVIHPLEAVLTIYPEFNYSGLYARGSSGAATKLREAQETGRIRLNAFKALLQAAGLEEGKVLDREDEGLRTFLLKLAPTDLKELLRRSSKDQYERDLFIRRFGLNGESPAQFFYLLEANLPGYRKTSLIRLAIERVRNAVKGYLLQYVLLPLELDRQIFTKLRVSTILDLEQLTAADLIDRGVDYDTVRKIRKFLQRKRTRLKPIRLAAQMPIAVFFALNQFPGNDDFLLYETLRRTGVKTIGEMVDLSTSELAQKLQAAYPKLQKENGYEAWAKSFKRFIPKPSQLSRSGMEEKVKVRPRVRGWRMVEGRVIKPMEALRRGEGVWVRRERYTSPLKEGDIVKHSVGGTLFEVDRIEPGDGQIILKEIPEKENAKKSPPPLTFNLSGTPLWIYLPPERFFNLLAKAAIGPNLKSAREHLMMEFGPNGSNANGSPLGGVMISKPGKRIGLFDFDLIKGKRKLHKGPAITLPPDLRDKDLQLVPLVKGDTLRVLVFEIMYNAEAAVWGRMRPVRTIEWRPHLWSFRRLTTTRQERLRRVRKIDKPANLSSILRDLQSTQRPGYPLTAIPQVTGIPLERVNDLQRRHFFYQERKQGDQWLVPTGLVQLLAMTYRSMDWQEYVLHDVANFIEKEDADIRSLLAEAGFKMTRTSEGKLGFSREDALDFVLIYRARKWIADRVKTPEFEDGFVPWETAGERLGIPYETVLKRKWKGAAPVYDGISLWIHLPQYRPQFERQGKAREIRRYIPARAFEKLEEVVKRSLAPYRSRKSSHVLFLDLVKGGRTGTRYRQAFRIMKELNIRPSEVNYPLQAFRPHMAISGRSANEIRLEMKREGRGKPSRWSVESAKGARTIQSEGWYGVKATASALGLSESHTEKLIRDGKIPSVRDENGRKPLGLNLVKGEDIVQISRKRRKAGLEEDVSPQLKQRLQTKLTPEQVEKAVEFMKSTGKFTEYQVETFRYWFESVAPSSGEKPLRLGAVVKTVSKRQPFDEEGAAMLMIAARLWAKYGLTEDARDAIASNLWDKKMKDEDVIHLIREIPGKKSEYRFYEEGRMILDEAHAMMRRVIIESLEVEERGRAKRQSAGLEQKAQEAVAVSTQL